MSPRPSRHRQARLVGTTGGAGPAARHRPLFRDLRQCDRRLHGHAPGRATINPATGKPWGLDFPGDHHRATWCGRRPCWSTIWASSKLFCVIGGSMGGMQALQWAARYPERVFAAVPIAMRRAPFGAEHRLPRSGPPGDHGRSRLARRRISDCMASSRRGLAVARMAAHITYLSEAALQRKFGRNLQNRDALSLRLRRRFPDRKLSAPSGQQFRRPLRRQFLSLHHPGHGLFRSGRQTMAAGWPTPSAAPRRASASSPSPATGCSPPAENRAIVHALNAVAANVSFVEIETDKGHDAFLLDEPEFCHPAGFLKALPNIAACPAGRSRHERPLPSASTCS